MDTVEVAEVWGSELANETSLHPEWGPLLFPYLLPQCGHLGPSTPGRKLEGSSVENLQSLK